MWSPWKAVRQRTEATTSMPEPSPWPTPARSYLLLPAKGSSNKGTPMNLTAAGIAVLILCSSSVFAQWPKYKEAGIPRDAEGRVLMEGRTPRMPDGKPDLSGDWVRADRDPLPQELAG